MIRIARRFTTFSTFLFLIAGMGNTPPVHAETYVCKQADGSQIVTDAPIDSTCKLFVPEGTMSQAPDRGKTKAQEQAEARRRKEEEAQQRAAEIKQRAEEAQQQAAEKRQQMLQEAEAKMAKRRAEIEAKGRAEMEVQRQLVEAQRQAAEAQRQAAEAQTKTTRNVLLLVGGLGAGFLLLLVFRRKE